MKTRVTDFWLYRWRYLIGYTAIIVAIGIVLVIASLYVPGALRQGEIDAALASGRLSTKSIDPHMVVDLPYHILQRLSFLTFGVTTLSIKLPSIVLGVLTSLGIFLLIRTWFRRNVAVLTTILATTCTQFLFLVQDGTPNIMFSFLTIWTLFAATYVTRKKTFSTLWKVLTGVLMAAALYTPLGIYLVVAVLTTMFFHPHIRHIVTHFARPRLVFAIALGIVSIVPLVYASTIDPRVALSLLGFPETAISMQQNLREVAYSLVGFFVPANGYLLRPVYSLGLMLLMMIGVYKLMTYKYTARSYITLSLGLLMVPLVLLNPVHVSALYPLAVLMIALGIATLITDWYKLFPRNPYARVAGLIPLAILVGGIVLSGVMRYMNNYEYNANVLKDYSSDLGLLEDQLGYEKATKSTTRLITSPQEEPFYSMVAHYDGRFTISTSQENPAPVAIVTHQAYRIQKPNGEPTMIVTNRFSKNADRFYIYRSVK
ncbi:glycosyltransferase family 39 protein [Candidatus Saccharibacteria bacterium]|nr:glycosyltransferase family 39 protein [Candidatus Saccharibacteria bacterium]